jgi:hypothetical protein
MTKPTTGYLWTTYRESDMGGFDIHGFKEQKGGVLDGQTIKCFITALNTMEEVTQAFPDAKPGSRWTDPQVSLNHLSDREGYSDDYDD